MNEFSLMLKISELIDESKYEEAKKCLEDYHNEKKIDIDNYVKLTIHIYFREHRFNEAQSFLEKNKPELKLATFNEVQIRIYLESNYINKAKDFFIKNKDISYSYFEGLIEYKQHNYKKAKVLLNDYISNNKFNNPALNSKLISAYIDCCIYTECTPEEKKFCINEIERLLISGNQSDKIQIAENTQYYLIYAFLKENNQDKKKYLEKFFEEAASLKCFDDLLKYSGYLKYKPEDSLDAFKKYWSKFDDNNYYSSIINQERDMIVREKYIIIIFWIFIIFSQLRINEDCEVEEFSYYTSKDALIKMIKHEYAVAMLSLSNVNDKVEGEVFFDVLKENGLSSRINCQYNSIYAALQTSYTRNKDSLTMFRLYGKEDQKEGTGVSLVFDKNFFLCDTRDLRNLKTSDSSSLYSSSYTDSRKSLVWVLYYNKRENKLFYYPSKNSLIPYEIYLSKTKGKWNSFKNNLKNQVENRLHYSIKSLITAINNIPSKKTKEKENAIKLLERLRYFIKYDEFAEEKECRMLDLYDPSLEYYDKKESKNKKIVDLAGAILKVDYKKIDEISGLIEIILGPKILNSKIMKELLMREIDKNKINPKLSISEAHLA